MQNNSAPRRIEALFVRLHVIQHDDATTKRILRSNMFGMYCRGLSFSWFSDIKCGPETTQIPSLYYSEVGHDSLFVANDNAHNLSKRQRILNCIQQHLYLFPICWVTSRRIPPCFILPTWLAAIGSSMQTCFLLETSLILKSDNFFIITILSSSLHFFIIYNVFTIYTTRLRWSIRIQKKNDRSMHSDCNNRETICKFYYQVF